MNAIDKKQRATPMSVAAECVAALKRLRTEDSRAEAMAHIEVALGRGASAYALSEIDSHVTQLAESVGQLAKRIDIVEAPWMPAPEKATNPDATDGE